MAANFYREVIVFGKCEKHGGGAASKQPQNTKSKIDLRSECTMLEKCLEGEDRIR